MVRLASKNAEFKYFGRDIVVRRGASATGAYFDPISSNLDSDSYIGAFTKQNNSTYNVHVLPQFTFRSILRPHLLR